MRSLQSISTLFLLFFSFFLEAQNYLPRIRHFTTEEGLSHNSVFCLEKDSRGFLWFGTDYGLNRFDGKNFEWYQKENRGLNFDAVHRLYEDAEGFLWLVTLEDAFDLDHFGVKSIQLLNIYTTELISLEEKFGEDLPFDSREVHIIRELEDKSLLIITWSGQCFKYHYQNGFEKSELDFVFGDILEVFPREDGNYWLTMDLKNTYDDEIFRKIDGNGKTLKIYDEYIGFRFYSAGQDQIGNEWFFLSQFEREDFPGFLFYFTPDEQIIFPDFSKFPNLSDRILRDEDLGQIHLDTFNQAFWAKANNQVFLFNHEEGLIYDFGDSELSTDKRWDLNLLFDGKTTWMVDEKSGLFAIELQPNLFEKYLNIDLTSDEEVYSCRGITVDDKKRIWLGSYNYGRVIDPQKETVTELEGIYAVPMLKDKAGNIWTVTTTDNLCRYEKESLERTVFENDNMPSLRGFWSLFEDPKGHIWFSLTGYLFHLDPNTGIYHEFNQDNGFRDYRTGDIYGMVERDEQSMWVWGSKGLFVLDFEKGMIAQYNSEKEEGFYIPAMDIHHLYEEEGGTIWLASGDGGLIKIEIDNLKVQNFDQFNVADGFPSNNLHAVYEDNHQQLWISSEQGIIQMDKNSLLIQNHRLEDGITHNEFNRISHHQDEDGKIYFGSVNGITVFDPDDFYDAEVKGGASPLQIHSYYQYSSATGEIEDETASLINNKNIVLQPWDRFSRLQVSLLDYENSEQIKIKYQLEGVEEQWSEVEENTITFNDIPYGNYLLKIKGQSGNGLPAANEIKIPIEVLRPIYLKGWFIGLSLFLLLLGFWAFSNYQENQLRNKIQEENPLHPPKLSQEDQDWLYELEDVIKNQIGNFNFNSEGLATDMALSRRQLNRRVKKLTELTVGEYIREVRFQQAKHYLETKKYATVKAVAYSIGVKSISYFGRQFKERYGKYPSEYLNSDQ